MCRYIPSTPMHITSTVKMTNALFLFATIFGFALTVDGSRCYQSYSLVCGSHDSTYDAVCDAFNDTAQPQSEVTCPGKCGLVTASYSYQGSFEVYFTFGTCSAGADGCLDEAQLAAQEPELEQQIKALEAGGLTVNDVNACTCSWDLCNSALNIATNPVVVLDGSRCYQSYSLVCGSHDSTYDAVCDAFNDTAQPQSEVTCPGKCGLVTASYSYQGSFEVYFTFGTCSAGADGCLDEAQLAAQEPELEQQIKALEAGGLTVNDVNACTCSWDLCNSALNIATNPVVVLNGSRCYQSYSIVCGSHDSTYDAVCDAFNDTAQPQSEVTCPGKCGLVTASYSNQGSFEVYFTFGTCSAGADGCLDEAQLAAQEPELEQQIKALEAGGLSVNNVYACTCSGDLCNNALNIATNPVVVFFSMMVVILQAFFLN
ncbi:uncharacterized protein [Apostichopus japonicus]|uniref:uncharacterized protein isoform X3 n=2 Tax=Stichopus japonicus TaxID=307972 RepID=UPI003AB3ADD9